jgi:hypothetical protein
MTFDRDAYQAQFDAAKRRLPKGHVITHAHWANGHLDVMSAPIGKPEHGQDLPISARGIQAQLL